MANKKQAYREANEAYISALADNSDYRHISQGVYIKVLESGDPAGKQPRAGNVVSVYYKGRLINGRVFDDNTGQGYPDLFRLQELITGWQIALTQMRPGDRWEVVVPAQVAYGSRGSGDIPGNSTLVFEIHLVAVN